METKPILTVTLALFAAGLAYFLTKLWSARSFFVQLKKKGLVSDVSRDMHHVN
jgi:hypothetical protein